MPHLHVSFMDFLVFMGYYLIAKLAVVWIQSRWPDSKISEGLAVLG